MLAGDSPTYGQSFGALGGMGSLTSLRHRQEASRTLFSVLYSLQKNPSRRCRTEGLATCAPAKGTTACITNNNKNHERARIKRFIPGRVETKATVPGLRTRVVSMTARTG